MGFIDDEVRSRVTNENPKPANLYANIKTHKDNWPYRFIISARNTATENLARWLEIKLKLCAMQQGIHKRQNHFYCIWNI